MAYAAASKGRSPVGFFFLSFFFSFLVGILVVLAVPRVESRMVVTSETGAFARKGTEGLLGSAAIDLGNLSAGCPRRIAVGVELQKHALPCFQVICCVIRPVVDSALAINVISFHVKRTAPVSRNKLIDQTFATVAVKPTFSAPIRHLRIPLRKSVRIPRCGICN